MIAIKDLIEYIAMAMSIVLPRIMDQKEFKNNPDTKTIPTAGKVTRAT